MLVCLFVGVVAVVLLVGWLVACLVVCVVGWLVVVGLVACWLLLFGGLIIRLRSYLFVCLRVCLLAG